MLFFRIFSLRGLKKTKIANYIFIESYNLGIGAILRGAMTAVAINYNIVEFDFLFCSFSLVIFAVSYRLEQILALLIAIDRLIAIWKPLWYFNNQNYVNLDF